MEQSAWKPPLCPPPGCKDCSPSLNTPERATFRRKKQCRSPLLLTTHHCVDQERTDPLDFLSLGTENSSCLLVSSDKTLGSNNTQLQSVCLSVVCLSPGSFLQSVPPPDSHCPWNNWVKKISKSLSAPYTSHHPCLITWTSGCGRP